MELFRLFGTVLIDDKSAIESLKKVDDKGKKTSTSMQDIATKGAKIGTAIVAGTGVAMGGLLALANGTSESAAKWLELSQRTDIGVESLQRWGYAASQSGADVGKLEVGMKKLSQSMIDAQGGSDKAKSAYEQLGISMSDLSTMSPEQTFDTVMNKLADMPESANKNVIGNQLLGKSYTELKPLLSEGSDGMQALKDKADELGIVMSEKSVVAAEGFGDKLDDIKLSFDGVKNKIVVELLPKLTEMLNWFIEKMPAIQQACSTALGFVSDTIGFITSNANILIPVLSGLVAGFIAMKVIGIINTLMTAYTTFTTTATGVQMSLNAAMMANPIGLVIAAITALIAIGVALYMNWDTIKEKATLVGSWISEKWEGIKTKTSEVWENVKDAIGTAVGAAKEVVQEKLNNMKKAFDDNGGGVKGTVAAMMEGVKGYYTAGFDFINKLTGGKLDGIKKVFTDKLDLVKEIVSKAIEKIKGFFDFKWELPKLKMPHFKIKGKFSLDPPSTPTLGVDWYAKGGIFSKPTLFNTPYGLKGVGDAKSPEVVAPLDNLKEMLGLNNQGNQMPELITAINNLASRPNIIAINGKEIVKQTASDMSIELQAMNKIGSRKVGVRYGH